MAVQGKLETPAVQHAAAGGHACIIAISDQPKHIQAAFWRGLQGAFVSSHGAGQAQKDEAGLLLSAALSLRHEMQPPEMAVRALCVQQSRLSDLLVPAPVVTSRAYKHLPRVRLRMAPSSSGGGGYMYTEGASIQRATDMSTLTQALQGACATLDLGMMHMGATPTMQPHSVFVSLFSLPSAGADLTQATGRLDVVLLPHIPAASTGMRGEVAASGLRTRGVVTSVMQAAEAKQRRAAAGDTGTMHVPYRDSVITRLLQVCMDRGAACPAACFWLGHVQGGLEECGSTLDTLRSAAQLSVPRGKYTGEPVAYADVPSAADVAAAAMAAQAAEEEQAAAATAADGCKRCTASLSGT